MEQMMEKGNYLRLKIDIDSDEHAEMSDSSRATADYLIGATKQQVLNNKETMQKLDAFLVRSGLKNTVPPAKENQPPFTMASSNPKTSPEIN
jgi:hypothetical protein